MLVELPEEKLTCFGATLGVERADLLDRCVNGTCDMAAALVLIDEAGFACAYEPGSSAYGAACQNEVCKERLGKVTEDVLACAMASEHVRAEHSQRVATCRDGRPADPEAAIAPLTCDTNSAEGLAERWEAACPAVNGGETDGEETAYLPRTIDVSDDSAPRSCRVASCVEFLNGLTDEVFECSVEVNRALGLTDFDDVSALKAKRTQYAVSCADPETIPTPTDAAVENDDTDDALDPEDTGMPMENKVFLDESGASRFFFAALVLLLNDRIAALPMLLGVASASGEISVIAGAPGIGSSLSQLNYPHGLHAAADGSVYVVDHYNHRVLRWGPGDTEGTLVCGGKGNGAALNQLDYPEGIFVDSDAPEGTWIYVADRTNNRVLRFTEGASFGVVVAEHNIHRPHAVDVVDGLLYVSEYDNHRVTSWAAGATEGTVVAGTGGSGSALQQLANPWGLRASSEAVVVVDRGRCKACG
jgi:hypothetical protein